MRDLLDRLEEGAMPKEMVAFKRQVTALKLKASKSMSAADSRGEMRRQKARLDGLKKLEHRIRKGEVTDSLKGHAELNKILHPGK